MCAGGAFGSAAVGAAGNRVTDPLPLEVQPLVQEQRVVFPTLRQRAPEHTRQRVAGLGAGPGSRGTVAGLPMKRFESLAPA